VSPPGERLLLEVRGADHAPAEFPRSGMMVVGSDGEKAGLHLEGQGVAGVHCAIGRTKDGGYAVKDLGSEYGTLLNGVKVAQARLELGDEILVGSVRLKVVSGAGAPDGAAPAPAPKKAPKPAPKPAASPPAKRRQATLPSIPGYRVSERLGRGAMGDVYLAVQESLDREVALKVLSQKHEQDQAFVQSFQAEARSAAALNHPNVVTVHDVGAHEGVHYLTMEYMDRGSLEERVAKEGALPWPIVLDVLKDAATGLVYAESRGIVHRDIKPANLMQNHTGATKIADLGLATSIHSEDAPDGQRKIFGTPHFISPEQIKGEKADCRSDLYSLGSTAYRLLTGHTPFEGGSTREILRAKLKGEHTPIHEHSPDVPPGLARIVERMLELEPAGRFPSASALLREIESLQAGPTETQVESDGGGSAMKVGIGVGLLVVIGLAAGSFLGGDDEKPRPDPGPGLGDPEPVEVGGDPEPEVPPEVDEGEEGDSDIEEKLFETAAENAFLRLAQRDLSPEERRDALRELAREYLGTTAATEATAEAQQIDEDLARAAEQTSQHEGQVSALMKLLTAAADLENPQLRPGNALRAMRAVEGQEALAADNVFLAERRKLEDQVVATALTQFAEVEARIEAHHAAGEFTEMRTALTDLKGRCDLPVFEEEGAPNRVREIEALSARLTETLDDLELLEIAYHEEKRASDRRAIGDGLAGLDAELAVLDFAAASERITAVRSQLASGDAQQWIDELAVELAAATGAIPTLVTDFSNWRRSKVDDPQDRSGASREAVSASATSLVLDVKGSRREVPWSAFGGQTKALDTLFSRRLDRNYTADERASIAALMHLSALTECLRDAEEMFAESSSSVFTRNEADDLPAPFDRALDWFEDVPGRARVEHDREAAALLGEALFSASEGLWTTSVSDLERLLRDYGDSWLVRMLSGGTTVQLPR